MKTGMAVTHIFLDKDTEDTALRNEILSVITALKIPSTKEWIQRFPMLAELEHQLRSELEADHDA